MQMENIEDIYELSPTQQGLLFHTLHAPESGVYFEQFCWQLNGPLHRSAFQQAWQRLCDRHSILRTAFCWEGLEQPYQVVYRQVELPWEEQDWRQMSVSDQEEKLQSFLQEDRDRGFVLPQAPLMRCTLIQTNEEAHYFIWSHHHLLLDGWSTALLFKEILADYQALSQQQKLYANECTTLIDSASPLFLDAQQGFNPPFSDARQGFILGDFNSCSPQVWGARGAEPPELPRPYRDYILWLQQQNPLNAEPFWRRYLQGFTAPTTINLEQPQDTNSKGDRAEQQIHLSAVTTQALKTFAQQQRLTLNTLVQAAWSLALSCYSCESDVVFGTVVAGRPPTLPGVESMVGLFINTLPLRVQVPPEAELIPWLQQLQAQQMERQTYEYSSLVQIQRWSEVPATLPLFNSILVFENYPIDTTVRSPATDLTIERISTFEQTNYPLTITAIPGEELLLQVTYNAQQFADAAIARLLGHLQTLLESFVTQPQTRLQEISLLTPAERHQLLVEWNDLEPSAAYTTLVDSASPLFLDAQQGFNPPFWDARKGFILGDFDSSSPQIWGARGAKAAVEDRMEANPTLCLHHLFEAQVERTPDAVALIHKHQQLTYRELNQRANQLAHHLQSLGVGPEVLVGICLPRSPDLIISLLAILKAGGAYVPLDPNYPEERLLFMLADAQVAVLLTQSDIPLSDSPGLHRIHLDTSWAEIEQQPTSNPVNAATGDNLAYIIYTSGSTGKPKGVMIEQRSLTHFITSVIQIYEIAPSDRVLQFASISFDAAVEEIFPTLVKGATLVLRTDSMIESIPRFLQQCQEKSITVLDLPTAFWHQLVHTLSTSNLVLPESLRLVIIGGEKALLESLQLWQQHTNPQIRLVNTYGPTETTVVATYCDIAGPRAVPCDHGIPIGRSLPNLQLYVLDAHQNPLPIGVPGELYIGGASVARGYLNRPDLTNERFINLLQDPEPSPPSPPILGGIDYSKSPSIKPFRASQKGGFRGQYLYKTGDRVRYRSDGQLEFLGRVDHQVKIRGFRVELGEIEAALAQHPHVREVVVLAQEEQLGQIRLVAYLSTAFSSLSQQDLREFLKQRLPSYMLPSVYVILDVLPLTPTGKLDRQALPSPQAHEIESASTTPPTTPTEIQLAHLWTELLSVPSIGIHDNFFELGGHSLLTTQLLSRIHTTFNVDLALRQLFEVPTIAALAALIDQQLNPELEQEQGTNGSHVVSDLMADAVLPDDIRPTTPPQSTQLHHLLLTGATGFLGAFLLAELLQQTAATIYCLVRAEDEISGQQRLQQSLQAYQLWQPQWRDRIIPVLGDLAQPNLGLSSPQYQFLAETVDAIYHNGAWVHHALPYASLKAANVLGTEAVLRLACQHHTKPVHFISTTSVFSSTGQHSSNLVRENDQPTLETAPLNGYAQTKWVSEQLILEARDRGLPVAIYRPGRISGHSQTGAFNHNDLLYRLIMGCIELGSAPEGEMQIDFAPVDYVSRAIVHLSQQPQLWHQTFHLVNPHPLSADELIHKIRALGYPLQRLPYDEWRSHLLQIAQDQPEHSLYPLIPMFPPQTENDSDSASLQFDCRNTATGLAGTAINCPPVSDALLETYFTYWIQNGHLHLPPSGAVHANARF